MGFINQNEFGSEKECQVLEIAKKKYLALYLPHCHRRVLQKGKKAFTINEQILPKPVRPNCIKNEVVCV